MRGFRFLWCLGLIVGCFITGMSFTGAWQFNTAAAEGETLRPEVGKPLQAAQELLKAQKYKEALAKVQEAEAVGNRTAYENFIIERMRVAAAAGSGDNELAAKSLEAVVNSGRLPAAEQLKMIEALAGTYYRAKEYGKAIAWGQRYLKEGGANSQIRTLVIQSQYLSGDYRGAAREINAELQSGAPPPAQERLQLLANCYLKLHDNSGYAGVLELLLAHYPKQEYWADLLARTQKKPGFSDRFALDVYRLSFATGNLQDAGDYMEMAQLALQAGLPAEAKKVIDDAYARGVFGAGNDAARQKRLRDLANKQYAEDLKALSQNATQAGKAGDGTALVNVGYAYVTNGEFDKGLALIKQGLDKGVSKRPEDAKLHQGLAYLQAGDRGRAVSILQSVQGNDGAADIARLWVLYSSR